MIDCRVCGNPLSNKVHLFRERYLGLGDSFEYIECSACHCLSIVTVPDDMNRYYPPTYYSYANKPYSRFLGVVKGCRDRHYLGRASVMGRLVSLFLTPPLYIDWLLQLGLQPGASVLDVGCGAGTLLVNLRDAGFKPLGIDPYIAQPIRYANGATVLKRSLEDITGSFDCLMLHHCLEHMASPRDVFRNIDRLLKPSGSLLIRVPVTGTKAWQTYGENWFQLDAPRHYVLFTETALCALAAEYGFQVSKIVYDSTASQFWGSEQYARGIAHTSDSSYAVNPGKSIFSREEIQAFCSAANELNISKNGDQAAFYFTRATTNEQR